MSFYTKGKIEKWINIYIENPFKTWWKARKYFKIPITKVTLFFTNRSYKIPSPYVWEGALGKILDIHVSDVWWKDKFNSPRHEANPHIFICFFKLFGIFIQPKIYSIDEFGDKKDFDMHYWEYILNYLYYDKGLKQESFWEYKSKIYSISKKFSDNEDGEEYKKVPMTLPIMEHIFSLNKQGLKEFKKLYVKN